MSMRGYSSAFLSSPGPWTEVGPRAEVFSGKRGKNTSAHPYSRERKKWEPPPEAVAEWERAFKHDRSLTGELCGDPRRGRSALDKKLNQQPRQRQEEAS